MEDQVLDRLDRVEPLGIAETGVHGEEDPTARRQEVVHRHPPEGAGAVAVKEGPAGAALEQLHAPPVDGERALPAGRGYGVFHGVESARDDPSACWLMDGSLAAEVALTIAHRFDRPAPAILRARRPSRGAQDRPTPFGGEAMTMLGPTTLVGSHPRPDWPIDPGRLGDRFPPLGRAHKLWRAGEAWLREAQDAVTLLAIRVQDAAGRDVITDGEIRRAPLEPLRDGGRPGGPMKIDVFPHIFPRALLRPDVRGRAARALMQKRTRKIPVMIDLDRRFGMMDRQRATCRC